MNTITFSLISVLAALSALTGCGYHPGDTYDVVIDSSAPTALGDDVVMATDMWTAKVPVRFNVTVSDHCDAAPGRICVRDVSHDELARLGANADVWATTRPVNGPAGREDGANVYVDSTSIWPDRLHVFVAHELGHAMGLEHSDKGTVMCPMNWCMSDHITDADIQQWHDVRR